MIAPSVAANVRVARLTNDLDLSVDAAWRGLGVLGNPTQFTSGNLFLGARLGFWSEGMRGRVGLGVVAPLVNAYQLRSLEDARNVLYAVRRMSTAWGAWDEWMSTKGFLPFVLRGDFEYRDELLFTGAEGAFSLMAPVEDFVRDAYLVAQIGVFVGVRPVRGLALGVRATAVLSYFVRDGSSAEGLLALAPFIRGEFGRGFVETRFLMNLDDPYGFAFDRGKFWSLQVTGGAQF